MGDGWYYVRRTRGGKWAVQVDHGERVRRIASFSTEKRARAYCKHKNIQAMEVMMEPWDTTW